MDSASREEAAGLWFEKAEEDVRAAQVLLDAENPQTGPVAFHCQQAAEKYLKGFLAYHDYEPPHTHNLRNLLGLAAQFDRALLELREAVDYLLPFAVDIRYPGPGTSVTEEEARAGLQHARRVRAVVRARLA